MQKMLYVRPGSVTERVAKDCQDSGRPFAQVVEEALQFWAEHNSSNPETSAVSLLKQALSLLEQK